MRKFKGVEGGTPTGPPLCRTCAFAHYTRGIAASDVHLYCRMMPTEYGSSEMKAEAYDCSSYEDKRQASLQNMYKTAWYLRTDEFRNSIGFVSAREWRKFRRDEEDEGQGPVFDE